MSTKNNKKSVAAQALLEMDSVVSALKEESKKTLGNMLNEVVKNALRESVEEKEDDDEKDYEVYDDGDEKGESDSSKKDVKEDDDIDAMPQQGNGMAQDAAPQQGAEAGQEMPADGAQEMPAGEEAPADDAAAAEPEAGMEDSEWDSLSKYDVGNQTYDFTNGKGNEEDMFKAWKLLNNDDDVVIKKDGNTISIKDNQAGTEYAIELGAGDDMEAQDEMGGGEDMSDDSLNEGVDDIAGFDDSDADLGVGDEEGDLGLDDEGSDLDSLDLLGDDFDSDSLGAEGDSDLNFGMEDSLNNIYENKKSKKPMKESKEVLFEVDLGYTDNYQDKDPIKGLSNTEPSKSGKSWHKGVPTGTEKPWAGNAKSQSKPFGDKTVEEEEEKCRPKCGKCGDKCTCEKELDEAGHNVGGFVQQNTTPGSAIPNSNGRKARSQRSASQGVEVTGTPDPRYKGVNESKELKAIKAENRELKKAVVELRKNLNEAYITNVNLGKITKLFLENTTSRSEKIDIVNRFSNDAKTVEQSNALYESIQRELKNSNAKKQVNLNETSATAKGTKNLNEGKAYQSADVIKSIDFMNRMLNL